MALQETHSCTVYTMPRRRSKLCIGNIAIVSCFAHCPQSCINGDSSLTFWAVTQADGNLAQPDAINLPPLGDSEAAEVQWVADAIAVWLDEEWLPQSVHRDLGNAAGQACVI